MPTPKRGLYEALVTQALEESLGRIGSALEPKLSELRSAEAADRIALHLARIVRRTLLSIHDDQRVALGIALARELIASIHRAVESDEASLDAPLTSAQVLRSIAARLPTGVAEDIQSPLIPLLDTTLLTNAPGEPRVGTQLQTEIQSADRIDVVMAFIRRTGIRSMLDALRLHCGQGRSARFLTTTYTGSTEARALDELTGAGAEILVSYDTSRTRLHAKAWLFQRESGFSTAFVGSSNLTYSAQQTGLEWNVRVSGARNPDVIEKIDAVFASYWNSGDFVPYDATEFRERAETHEAAGLKVMLSPVELRLEPFQERLLEQIESSRKKGHQRNLLVSATGTGKTVMAAVDYLRLRDRLPRARLLFVAHRKEILEQSLATFRHAMREHSFGELWVGRHRPTRFEHVFASIQSLNKASLSDLEPDHFDVVIVDEFHHAAAPTYSALLDHVQPKQLLGLTATPERSDGLPVLRWFDDRIAAELRLWHAIDQQRLVPFLYYGVHDGVDLRQVTWKRSRGYDVDGLSKLLTGSDHRARLVLKQLLDLAENRESMRVLGFCVSVEHARFMAHIFQKAGIAATAIWGDSPQEERERALRELASGKLNVLFSVDLFNEGVDVPTVDTLLLLRPTDSPTLFLQQLGRGLRRSPGKTACTVLDFIGQHRREFRFDRRLRALLGGSRRDLMEQVQGRFPFLPAGCHMELDAVASKIVLDNIRHAVPSQWTAKAEELRQLAESVPSGDLRLAEFLEMSGLELEDLYKGSTTGAARCWSALREEARLPVAPAGPVELKLRRACGRLLHINDPVRIDAYRSFLERENAPDSSKLAEHERRLLRMLVASLVDRSLGKKASLDEGAKLLWRHPQVRAELIELFDVLSTSVDHVHYALEGGSPSPLQVHGRYTRLEILAGFGVGTGAKVAPWQQGVLWAKEANADLLAFTLDKTSGQFSPTTRYRDFAINRELIHWESQSVTRENSETGLRYQHHVEQGSEVMLFARLRSDERAFWFLGPATYVSHRSERPMAITWKLKHRLSGDLYASFAAAVA